MFITSAGHEENQQGTGRLPLRFNSLIIHRLDSVRLLSFIIFR